METSQFEGAYAVSDIVNTESGEVILEANNEITPAKLQEIVEGGIDSFSVFFPERDDIGSILSQTLKKDVITKPVDALLEIYRKMRPGDPPTVQTAYKLLEAMFFDPRKFDFSRVGRLKFNIKMGKPERDRINDPLLSAKDFYEVVAYVLKMRKNPSEYQADDIDHLGNRRVRAVGELLENQFRIGLERMERAIKEKMSIHQEMQTTMPRDLINAKPVTAAVREFFGSSQLSQFMDQTNPLSEITHKRRLSALGPGGLSRERAGFEVRDVHPTHYGRICPIETPEGPNIGLISSLSCFARINEFGFIESPYRKVTDGKVVEYVRVLNGGDTKLKPGEHVPLEDVEKANKKVGAGGRKAELRAMAVLSDRVGRRQARHRSGQHRAGRNRLHRQRAQRRAQSRRVYSGAAQRHRIRRRFAEAARFGGRFADSVPRKRRREPRADGFEHAAPVGAAAARRSSVHRHRHGANYRARFGCGGGCQTRRRGRLRRLRTHHHQGRSQR